MGQDGLPASCFGSICSPWTSPLGIERRPRKGETLTSRLRLLGMQITETGIRPCASPVGRIMAYAATKIQALSDIISTEMQSLGNDIRAVVVTDFEKTSATTLVEGVMDEEAGGAIAAFRALVQCDSGDILDPDSYDWKYCLG